MATLPFVPTPCVVNVSTFEKDVQVGAVKLTGGRSYTTWQLHDATIIPLSLAEAVERVVKAKRALDAMLDAEPFVLNDDLMLEMDAAINAMVTLWPEAQP